MIGRALRAQMRDVDTPERIAERVRFRAIGDQAHAEMLQRFTPLTAKNAAEALDWQAARIRQLTEAAS